jgi:L-iditol 2-dehydrogenase
MTCSGQVAATHFESLPIVADRLSLWARKEAQDQSMKALVLKEYKKLAVEEVADPTPADEEVLIAVKACGICGSDVHGMDGSTGRRRPPIIMGHEAAGVVVQTGKQVETWKAGDRVTFDSTVYCGACEYCRKGQINLCNQRRVLGVSCEDYRRHGAFADLVAVPQRILCRVPESLPFEQAALVEPLSIAFHAVRRSSVTLNDTAVVVGAGMIGLLLVQALRAAGCGQIIAVDLAPEKLAMASQVGATTTVNSAQSDPLEAILSLTDSRGADLSFEAVGIDPTVDLAIRCVRKGGSVTLVGNVSPKVTLPLQVAVTRELTLLGSCASCGEYPACLDALARGTVRVAPLISAVAPLEEGPTWFDRLYRHEPGLLKVVLKP